MTAEELDWPSRASAAAAGGAVAGIGRDTADLTELFRQHQLELVRLAALLVRNREAGEDIVQDVFIKVHARRGGPPDPAGALAYLRRAVVNGCRSWLRHQAVARRLGSADRTAMDVHESAEHAAITAENRRRLQSELSVLPARRREVLVLRYYVGLSEAEIARTLGISQGTVKSAAARGIRSLAKALGGVMTRTERLLSSTLAEEAATITLESLRPLTGPAKELEFQGLNRPGQRWLRPLTAAAAAVSVLLVISFFVVARPLITAGPPFANIGTATSPPRYYVEIDVNGNVLVQSTATGRRTDIVATPFRSGGGTGADAALAVSADGRTYVAAYNDWDSLRTNLFRFTLTSAGQVEDFSKLTTGRLPGLTEPSLAISANGTQLALAGIPDQSRSVEPSSGPPRLLVVNLRTGQVRTWHGLAGTGPAYSIEDPAWTTSRSLRFLVMKCHPSRAFPFNATCQGGGPAGPPGPPAGAEWTLNIPHGSAPLGPGRVLVRLPGMTVQVLIGPGANSVTALQLLHTGGIRIARYDVVTGRLQHILYRGAGKSNFSYDWLAVDGSGKYLLINNHMGAFFGWIRDGQFHKLPVHAPFGNNEIVAATW